MLSIAALLSKGEPLPFTDTDETEPMTIIYQTTEDDADDTVVPRFNAAGGIGENLMSYDSIIEVLALALLEQANEVGCLEVLDGFSQRPDTEIEVSAPISEEMLILPLDKQEWPEECAPILKESGATTLGELVEYLNHCAASGKKPNVSEDAAAAMFPALIAFCYNNADTDGKRFFWEYILESNSLVFEGVE